MTTRRQHRSSDLRGGVLGALVPVLAGALAAAGPSPAPLPSDSASVPAPRRLFVVFDRTIEESSGLARARRGDALFTVEDAGRPSLVHALGPDGRTRLRVELPDVPNWDWEDLATGHDEDGTPVLFIGDVGDAFFTLPARQRPRRDFVVLRIDEPEVPTTPADPPPTQTATGLLRFPVRYADGAARNAEALAVHPETQQLVVVNKVGGTRRASVWTAPVPLVPDRPNDLTEIGRLPIGAVTAADFSPDGAMFAVRTEQTAFLWSVPDGDLAAALEAAPRQVDLPAQRQGESLTFDAAGTSLLVGSEGPGEAVWQVPLTADPVGYPSRTPPSPAPAPPDAATGSAAATRPWLLAAAGGLAVLAVALLVGTTRQRR